MLQRSHTGLKVDRILGASDRASGGSISSAVSDASGRLDRSHAILKVWRGSLVFELITSALAVRHLSPAQARTPRDLTHVVEFKARRLCVAIFASTSSVFC